MTNITIEYVAKMKKTLRKNWQTFESMMNDEYESDDLFHREHIEQPHFDDFMKQIVNHFVMEVFSYEFMIEHPLYEQIKIHRDNHQPVDSLRNALVNVLMDELYDECIYATMQLIAITLMSTGSYEN